jgi:outer membrane protein assembly factor BamD (BamD/ComL family)
MWIRVPFVILTIILISTNSLLGQTQKVELANEYYYSGEIEKAKSLFEELSKQKRSIPLIHTNYLRLMIEDHDFNGADKYLRRVLKQYPENLYYQIDYGLLLASSGKESASEKVFDEVIREVRTDQQKIRIAAQYFVNKDLSDYAIKLFQEGRKYINNPYFYSLDLANIYRRNNQKEKMVREYLNFVEQNPANLSYVKRILQSLLTEEDLISLETILYEYVQRYPEKVFYSDLLIWVNLQQKNFYGAFIQARAYDKRFSTEGKSVIDIGFIAFDNEDYRNASKIFEYIVNTYPQNSNRYYVLARRYNIMAKEEIVKNKFPVDRRAIQNLIVEYDHLIDETGINTATLEGLRSQALLYAFYLNDWEKAISILNQVIENPRAGNDLVSRSKLDLGDIYLLIGQSWESTLLYSQVEKTNKEEELGYEAKLRNAKLSYFKGEFELAEAHLDVLKLATSREIANDAMALSLLIKDNTVLDSTYDAMSDYASVELLLFQNKEDSAMLLLDHMLEAYSGHSLEDEILWLKADILLKKGSFDASIQLLEKIHIEHSYDILGDDAYFLMGSIYEEQLEQLEVAQEIYRDFLTRFPGSKYTAEARKRFRNLRGDFIN